MYNVYAHRSPHLQTGYRSLMMCKCLYELASVEVVDSDSVVRGGSEQLVTRYLHVHVYMYTCTGKIGQKVIGIMYVFDLSLTQMCYMYMYMKSQ